MHLMDDIMLLVTGHRLLIMGLVSLVLWTSAYYLYAKRYLKAWWNRSRSHSWTVDMANKRASSRGKFEA